MNWGGAVEEAQSVAWERGIDISGHRPRQLTPRMTQEADMIIVMTEGHRQRVAVLNPEAGDRTHLLRRIGNELQGRQPVGFRDLDDPIGRPPAAYRKILRTITGELEKGLELILNRAAERRSRIEASRRAEENEPGAGPEYTGAGESGAEQAGAEDEGT